MSCVRGIYPMLEFIMPKKSFAVISLLVCGLAASFCNARDSRLEAKRQAFEKMGEIKKWRERPWSAAYTYNTRHYQVKSNTTHTTAQYIGNLMEYMVKEYREAFGYRGAISRLPVYAYASRNEYETLAVKGKFAFGQSGGFYSPSGKGAIHLPYIKETTGSQPSLVLFHEGTHQFVHQAIDFQMPISLRSMVPKQTYVLSSVPIWLNEGLATYMETAHFTGEDIEIGYVNANRLMHLQQMLRSKTNPSVREVVSRSYGQPFSSPHYAVAWGLVYLMRHDWNTARGEANKRKLIKYIKCCKRGFYHAPAMDFRKEFLAEGKLPRDFWIRWNTRIGKKSLEEFERTIVGRGKKLEDWEAEWAARIMKLNPRQKFGGTYRGVNAKSGNRGRLY